MKLPASEEVNLECLDIMHNITDKYSSTHKVILRGDFKGSQQETSLNPRDAMLKILHLKFHSSDCPPFYGHADVTSQIGYTLSNNQINVISQSSHWIRWRKCNPKICLRMSLSVHNAVF